MVGKHASGFRIQKLMGIFRRKKGGPAWEVWGRISPNNEEDALGLWNISGIKYIFKTI